jgi:hypothetical protein
MPTTSNTEKTILPATGEIGISDVNVLKKVLSNTVHNASNSKFSLLRDWFRDNIGTRGNAGDEENALGEISLGRFRDNYIYGFGIKATSESANATYKDNDDATVTFYGIKGNLGSTAYTFTFNGTSKTQQTTEGSVQFTGISGMSLDASNTYVDYSAAAQHRKTADSISFTVRVGYDTTDGKIIRSQTPNIDDTISTKQQYLVGTKLYKI